jgi:hypothetical protein
MPPKDIRYKTTIIVHPFGRGYVLGEGHEGHDAAWFSKNWHIVECRNGYAAQDKHRGGSWNLAITDSDGLSVPCPCGQCAHEFEYHVTEFDGLTLITGYCPKCYLKRPITNFD